MELNNLLAMMQAEIEAILRDAIANNKRVTSEYVKEQFSRRFQRKLKPDFTFYDYYNQFIEISETIKGSGVIAVYNASLKRLKEFETTENFKISFDRIDNTFYEKFVNFLIDNHRLNNNSVGKHIKTLKTFLNWATDKEYNKNMTFSKFKVFKEDADTIYLNEDELNKLYQLDLKSRPGVERVRDAFLVQCYTGLRFSDISNLKAENFNESYIMIGIIKTRERLRIPLIPRAQAILSKYENYCIELPTNQKMNKHLKELGRLAGFDELVQVITYRGSKREERTIPKSDLLTTHCGRRTFITLSLEKGMRAELVMKVTGHRSTAVFRKYIKLTDNVVNDEMQKAWTI